MTEAAALSFDTLVEQATAGYAAAGRYAHGFARGKLRHDPVFRALLARGLLPARVRLLDLGCGLGVLPALLDAAAAAHRNGTWIADWPTPPQPEQLTGIELLDWKVAAGQAALGARAHLVQGDIRSAALPTCNVVVVLDVLLYLAPEEQLAVLARIAEALAPDGMLILREADAAAGWRFHATRLAEQACCLARGQGWARLHYRSAAQWRAALAELGFAVQSLPMSVGTPFGNVLHLARRSGAQAC